MDVAYRGRTSFFPLEGLLYRSNAFYAAGVPPSDFSIAGLDRYTLSAEDFSRHSLKSQSPTFFPLATIVGKVLTIS